MVDTTSRFITLAEPKALPGCCLACSGATGPFIDFGRSIQYYGRLYLCFKCLREMARALPVVKTDSDIIKQQYHKSGYEAGVKDERDDIARSLAITLRSLGLSDTVAAVLADTPANSVI